MLSEQNLIVQNLNMFQQKDQDQFQQQKFQKEDQNAILQVLNQKQEIFRIDLRNKKVRESLQKRRVFFLQGGDSNKRVDNVQDESEQEQCQQQLLIQSLNSVLPQYISQNKEKLIIYVKDLVEKLRVLQQQQICDDQVKQKLQLLLKDCKKLTFVKESKGVELLLENGLQEILFILIQDDFFQKQVMEILVNVVFFEKKVWFPLVEKDDFLCQIFIQAFKSQDFEIVESGIVGLGNICVDYPQVKERAINLNCRDQFKALIKRFQSEPLKLKKIIWLLNIFCDSAETEFWSEIDYLLGLKKLPENIKLEILICLNSLISEQNEKSVLNFFLMQNWKTVFDLVSESKEAGIVLKGLEILQKSIKKSQPTQIKILIENNLFQILINLFDSLQDQVRIKASHLVQILFSFNEFELISNIIEHDSLIDQILYLAKHDHHKVRANLYFSLASLLINTSPTQTSKLMAKGVQIEILQAFDFQDTTLFIQTLKALTNCLYFGQQLQNFRNNTNNLNNAENPVLADLQIHNFYTIIEELQNHPSETVYQLAIFIIENFIHSNDKLY